MGVIRCGWCAQRTANEDTCDSCGRDPVKPYRQRGTWPPVLETPERGRPALDVRASRQRVAEAERELAEQGRPTTVEAIAELLGVAPRTVRRWRQ